jgi:hypothetical protein
MTTSSPHLLEELSLKLGPNRVNMKVQTNEFEQQHGIRTSKDTALHAVDLMDEARRASRSSSSSNNAPPRPYHHVTDMYACIESAAAARHGYVAPANGGSLKDDLLQRVLSARTRFKSEAQTCLHACKPHEVVLKALVAALGMSVVWPDDDSDPVHNKYTSLHDEATMRTGAVLVVSSPPRIADCFRTVLLEPDGAATGLLAKEFLLRFSMADLKDLADHAEIAHKGIKKKDVLAETIVSELARLRARGSPAARR